VLYLRGFIGGSSLQAKINIAWRACIDDAVLVKGAWSHAGPGKNPLLLFRDSLLHHAVNRNNNLLFLSCFIGINIL